MASIALGSVTGRLLITTCRGGESENFIDVSDIICGIEEGFSYVDNVRLKKIIISLYRHKARNGVIFITGTAVCQIAKLYGVNFPALSIPIQDFGITNMIQAIKKH